MSIQSVLTVCIGNICRSPMAHVLLAQALPDLRIASAGTAALVGHPADSMAVELMRERGLDLSGHRATQVSQLLCQQADLILVMDPQQRQHLENRYPQVRGKIYRIGHFIQQDVPDPYQQPRAAFEHALALIEQGVQDWTQRIRAL